MLAQTDMLEFLALCATALGFLAMLAYVGVTKARVGKEKKKVAMVSKVMVEYFRKTGVDVAVNCVSLGSGKRFTAFVESEPMKQFRLSHIIEMTLRDHVQKSCGVELDKVFWRFPIKVSSQAKAVAAGKQGAVPATSAGTAGEPVQTKKIEGADDYINEGLVHYKDLPKSEATEIPWEIFEEAANSGMKTEAESKV